MCIWLGFAGLGACWGVAAQGLEFRVMLSVLVDFRLVEAFGVGFGESCMVSCVVGRTQAPVQTLGFLGEGLRAVFGIWVACSGRVVTPGPMAYRA